MMEAPKKSKVEGKEFRRLQATMTDPTLTFVINLALDAGHIIDTASRAAPSITEKQGRSDLVTATDIEVERFLVNSIRSKFPHHLFLCEESMAGQLTEAPTWVIDPIDGTANFAYNNPAHSVSIAYVVNYETQIGVVYLPMQKDLFTAEKGRGSFLNGRPIHVAVPRAMENSLVKVGWTVQLINAKPKDDEHARLIKEFKEVSVKNFHALLENVMDTRRGGASSIDICEVACGRCDAFFEIGPLEWDVAAARLVLSEAGGLVMDFEGNPMPWGGRHCLAVSNISLGETLGKILTPFPPVCSKPFI